MRKESFERADSKIRSFFERSRAKAYTSHDIQAIFESNRNQWRIAGYRNYKHFITYLKDQKILVLDNQIQEVSKSKKQILRKKNATPFHVGLTVKKEGYLSHYSAMQIHELTLQIPKTVYVSEDHYQSTGENKQTNLEQAAVDKAFSKPQRVAHETYRSEFDGFRYFYLQRKHKSINTGVVQIRDLKVTDLERTLIDIAVRPVYSGGSFQVVEAFKNAKENLDVKRINQYLNELDYIYPYHQLLGFYLDLVGMSEGALDIFLKQKSHINFYQTYNLTNKRYNQKWGIYYPKGLEGV